MEKLYVECEKKRKACDVFWFEPRGMQHAQFWPSLRAVLNKKKKSPEGQAGLF